jgi:lysophospholipase L1-like esterase
MIVRTRPSIILFGDSITQSGFSGGGGSSAPSAGWVSLLSSAYARRADVLNRGFSGYNTRHALEVLSSVFVSSDTSVQRNANGDDRVLMVTVFFGANDASLPGDREHCQHVPIDEYEHNMRKIVKTIR